MLPRKARGCSFCQSTKKCRGEGDDSLFELVCGCCLLLEGDDSELCYNGIRFSDLNRINGRYRGGRGQLVLLNHYEQDV